MPRRLTPPGSRCHESCSSRVGQECDECGGSGYLEPEWAMQGDTHYPWEGCDGTGRVPTDRCDCGRADGIAPEEFADG